MHEDAVDALIHVIDAINKPMDYTVFYAGLLYGSYPAKDEVPFHELPDGCYLRNNFTKRWFIKRGNVFEEVPDPEVPKNLKAMCLLLNIT